MLYSRWTDITKVTDARTALVCARLHLRSAKRRLKKGFSVAGLTALYDAVLFGMHYYIIRNERCASFVNDTDIWDAAGLFHALVCAGVFDDPLTFNRFSLILERALWQESFSFDANSTLAEVEKILMQLGIITLNRSVLSGKSLTTH